MYEELFCINLNQGYYMKHRMFLFVCLFCFVVLDFLSSGVARAFPGGRWRPKMRKKMRKVEEK